ncbi:MAG TPA: Na+/H+ antiporter [Acidobacteriaceae bacterium]|nr:Na+/H+ antiporter [Acidobacteriaceae bacterium]
MEDVNYVLVLLIGLLCAVAAVAGLARRFAVSYPIFLVIFGLLCSLLPRVPRIPLPPSLVFLVILPPLLYVAAWQTSWREFRYNLVSISSLAVFLVFFTAFGVAFAAHWWLPGFDWRLGFLLGAVVSPTDAVAATSIARKVGMPQRIVDLLEGESLLNDATGLLALEFGIEMVVDGITPTVGRGVVQFLWLTVGGLLVGLMVGWVVAWLERWLDDGPVEIAVSLIVPYAAYLTGEAVKGSGVIAVVACGLFLSKRSSSLFSPGVRLQAWAVWDALEFLLNGLVFVMIGLQLPYVLDGIHGQSKLSLLGYGLAFSAVLVLLRMLWMYPAASAAWWIRTRIGKQHYDRPGSNQVFVVGWTGMRGVVALAAANSLPLALKDGSPFPQRSFIIYLTFSLILVTLVLQGLSLPWLVRTLRLAVPDMQFCGEAEARHLLLQAAVDLLRERGKSAQAGQEAHLYADLLHQYEHKMAEIEDCDPVGGRPASSPGRITINHLMLETIRREREELNLLRANGRITELVHRTLEHELDLSESRLS